MLFRYCRPGVLKPRISHRSLAQTDESLRVVGRPPPETPLLKEFKPIPNELDSQVLKALKSGEAPPSLNHLLQQYMTRAGNVLNATLPYESTPPPPRRVSFHHEESGVTLLTHVVDDEQEHKITFCSGFALSVEGYSSPSSVIISCAHTLEEMQHSQLMKPKSSSRSATITFNKTKQNESHTVTAGVATEVLASLPRSDLVLYSSNQSSLRTLPISPYPARVGTRVRAHFVSETRPSEDGWKPWIHGTWCKWVRGKVIGYRDFAGRESKTGTYDSLSHLVFHPLPSPGSSGGPIVDEENGAVIGVILGSRMYNRVEGVQGWGVPSEVIYEMFKLPGLTFSV